MIEGPPVSAVLARCSRSSRESWQLQGLLMAGEVSKGHAMEGLPGRMGGEVLPRRKGGHGKRE